MRELRLEAEAERQALERELLADLHREPSVTERIAIETLSAQVVRARRMRQAGRHEQAEMAERLATRSLTKLGIRQGATKPDPLKAIEQHVARQRAAAQAVQSAPAVPEQPAADTRVTGLASASDGRP